MTEETFTDQASSPEPKSKLAKFVERLRAFPDEQTAKANLGEIAKEIGCARSLGYKAIRDIKESGGFSGEPIKLAAKEPTAKIDETPPEQIITDQEEQEQEMYQDQEAPPTTEAAPETAAPPEIPLTNKALANSLYMAFDKVGVLIGYRDFALTHDEAQNLADAWLPVFQFYAPQLAANPVTWAGIATVMILAPRLLGYLQERRKRAKEQAPPTPPRRSETPPTPPPTLPQAADDKTPLETPPQTLTAAVQNETTQKPKAPDFIKKL